MSELSKKRKKKYFGGGFKKCKYALNLCPGIKGFLCTHSGKPKFCIREAYNMLDEFSSSQSPEDSCSESRNDEDDFESELKRDIENVQNEAKEKRFQVVETGVSGCIFIKTTIDNPLEIMEKIIQAIVISGKCQSRNILRMLPIQVTCKAYLDDIKKAVIPLLDDHFKGDPRTYAIVVNRRNNSNILWDEIVSSLGLLIRDRNPFHSANLKDPQLTVLVEILKSVCCLSILTDYRKHRKYNLVELNLSVRKSKDQTTTNENEESNKDEPAKDANNGSVDSNKEDKTPQDETHTTPSVESNTDSNVQEDKNSELKDLKTSEENKSSD